MFKNKITKILSLMIGGIGGKQKSILIIFLEQKERGKIFKNKKRDKKTINYLKNLKINIRTNLNIIIIVFLIVQQLISQI